jgi:hypothetical protein
VSSWKLLRMTTNIRGNSFLTTNEILIVYNHFFEKLLKNPHIKTSPKLSLSLLFSLSPSLSLSLSLCSLSRSALSLCSLSRCSLPPELSLGTTPGPAEPPDVTNQRRTKAPPGRRTNQRRWFVRRPGGAFVRRWFVNVAGPGDVRRLREAISGDVVCNKKEKSKKPKPNLI